jgi:nucleoid-associated protein YgaU
MTKAGIGLTSSAQAGSPSSPAPSGDDSSSTQVDHATLELHHTKPAKGGSRVGDLIDRIPFQFNPKEMTIAKSAKWERKAARGAPTAGPPEFSGAEPCKLTLEMFFDATGKHDGSVVAAVEKLFSCCVPTEQSRGQNKASPPLVVFVWGTITSFPAFVTQVSAKYTLFDSNGTPLRAVCSVSLEEMPGGLPGQNPTSGALAVHRVHRMIAGDNLALLAFKEYGDPNLWRELARYNGIDDPLRVRTGTEMLLPAPEELAVVGID